MTKKNKYANHSKISKAKFREIFKLFSLDLDAGQIAELSGLNRNTINRDLMAVRERIAEYCEMSCPVSGEIEVDESYFGARRVRGKREQQVQAPGCAWKNHCIWSVQTRWKYIY